MRHYKWISHNWGVALPKVHYLNLRASERSKRLGEMEPANEFLLLKGTMNKMNEGRARTGRWKWWTNIMRQNIAPTACRVSVHAVVVAVGFGWGSDMPREMKRFIIEKTGPNSDGIWEIRTMNRCYHSEAKYGMLSDRCRARGRQAELGKVRFWMGLEEMRMKIHDWGSWTRFGQNMGNQNESMLSKYGMLSRSLSRERRKGGAYPWPKKPHSEWGLRKW